MKAATVFPVGDRVNKGSSIGCALMFEAPTPTRERGEIPLIGSSPPMKVTPGTLDSDRAPIAIARECRTMLGANNLDSMVIYESTIVGSLTGIQTLR